MNTNVNRDFIKIEKKRSLLAKGKKYEQLLKTYLNNKLSPTQINTQKFWNKKIKNNHYELLKSPIYVDKIQIVTNYLKHKSGRFLDVGLGYGDIEKILCKNNSISLCGIDISDVAIRQAKRNYGGNFKTGNILDIPFDNNFFKYVCLLDVIEHVPSNETFKALKEISRVMIPGGILILSVPLNEHINDFFDPNNNPNGHMRVYTQELILSELEMSGFKVNNIIQRYAFKNFYRIKNLIVQLINFKEFKANLCIVIAQKK